MSIDPTPAARDQPDAASSIGSWDWNVVSDRVTADLRFAKMYGVAAQTAVAGAPIVEFFANIHSDDLPAVQAAIAQAVATGDPFEAEYRLIQPDGRARWVIAQGSCTYDEQGRPARFPGITFDIDARKSAALRTTALVELNDRLREPGDAADLGYATAEVLGRTFGVSRVGYGTIDPEAETIVTERPWCAPGIEPLPAILRFRDYGSYIEDLKAGRTVAIGNVDDDPRTRDGADALKGIAAASFVNMPVTEQGGFVALAVPQQCRDPRVDGRRGRLHPRRGRAYP